MGRPVFLGKAYIHWCGECNVPLIGESCAVHGKEKTFKLNITPPGDLRFAFERDIEFIRSIFKEHYGVDVGELFEGKIVLLNKTPGEDDTYEMIVDGYVFGWIRFDPIELRWKPGLKTEGAIALWKRFGKKMRKWIIVDEGAIEPILSGSNLLPVGILEAEESIKVSDDVVLISPSGEVVATGIAKKDYSALIARERGTGVKVRRQKSVNYREGRKTTMEDVLRANSIELEKKVAEAKRFMRKTAMRYSDLPIAVAFSGGKDSLAVLGLALEEFGEEGFTVFFNNTGIEFPETLEYVKEFQKELEPKGIKFVVADAGDAFWRALHVFSPPGRDYRWCCKVTKLGPITMAIKENYPEGVLMFVGQRKYESIKRFKQPRIWKNPWVPNETGASPIFHWRALEVWLYIFSRGLKYNPLYEDRLDRIGCFLCPSSSLAEIYTLKEEKPELWAKWENELERWRRRFNLPEEWITYGFWRWKKLSRGEKAIARELGVEISEERSWEPVKYSIEETSEGLATRFNTVVNLKRIHEVAPILGEVEEGENYIRAGKVTFRPDGAYTDDFNEALQAYYLVKRAYECVGCGVCVGKCPEGALSIDPVSKKIMVNPELCIHCRECMDVCPLLKIKNPEEGSQL
ncbi:3'-phosphoadenosine 5'-phosphosulfate reductase [Thermococcus onnurineus NA1]|uniref:3'-phosphoadenosine 5'-phosphosulfate reductase n=1 Tax=Thermococcus onnurineus (strain NA1) TaxID=523850 RepID=B6YWI2_THEON|nr:phosphoadenosine phosphosulfate reductase family protein [Thermococcus onnurineus]ACJ16445.1 3'-phosphoadenosine 5'-phosphosulfate reductase [Thermococcus onnurineus NA1]